MSLSNPFEEQAIVVGGGLAGLTAAAFLARAGLAVAVFDQAPRLGGRAVTDTIEKFHYNLGPHALYRGGEAARVLAELDVSVEGQPPPSRGLWALRGDRCYRFPSGPVSMLKSKLFDVRAKLEVVQMFRQLSRLDLIGMQGLSLGDWCDSHLKTVTGRELLLALVRLSTYCHPAEHLDAGIALGQLQLALGAGVSYLHGGWQSLVNRLTERAQGAGARFETRSRVVSVEISGGRRGVKLADGEFRPASILVLAIDPWKVLKLVGRGRFPDLETAIGQLKPALVACLDVGLKVLPSPGNLFALGVDRPFYLSVHSATADLAPPPGAVVHVARYLDSEEGISRQELREDLEALLDTQQPGWRSEVMECRFMPKLVASHWSSKAGQLRPSGILAAGLGIAGDREHDHGFSCGTRAVDASAASYSSTQGCL